MKHGGFPATSASDHRGGEAWRCFSGRVIRPCYRRPLSNAARIIGMWRRLFMHATYISPCTLKSAKRRTWIGVFTPTAAAAVAALYSAAVSGIFLKIHAGGQRVGRR